MDAYSDFDQSVLSSSTSNLPTVKTINPLVVAQNYPRSASSSIAGLSGALPTILFESPAKTTTIGLAAMSQNQFKTIPLIHSINGERIIDEIRELADLNQFLSDTIVECCYLESLIRDKEHQINVLNNKEGQSADTIRKIFNEKLEKLDNNLRKQKLNRNTLDKDFRDGEQTIGEQENIYERLLTKRNDIGNEIFENERKIAQNGAENLFLQRRIRDLQEECQFYLLKNQALEARKSRIRFELDEETFANQGLKLESELLEKDKISREDINANEIDKNRKIVQPSEISENVFSKSFRDDLMNEVQRIRNEFGKKTDAAREELHRKYDLAFHRYQMEKVASAPSTNKEQELQIERFLKQKQEVQEKLAGIQVQNENLEREIRSKIEQIHSTRDDFLSKRSNESNLRQIQNVLREKENQLAEALAARKTFKEQIDSYKQQMNRYQRSLSPSRVTMRTSSNDGLDQPAKRLTINTPRTNSWHESSTSSSLNDEVLQKNRPASLSSASIIKKKTRTELATLIPYGDFNCDKDCRDLNRILCEQTIDESGIIRILCNRNVHQRLSIADRYRTMFNQELRNHLEMVDNQSLRKLFRILVLTPVEHDSIELRRLLRNPFDDMILVDILFTRPRDHIAAIQRTYPRLFDTKIDKDIISDRPVGSREILYDVFMSQRPETTEVDSNTAYSDAQQLFRAGPLRWSQRDSIFAQLLCTRSNAELLQTFNYYHELSGVHIEEVIRTQVQQEVSQTFAAIEKRETTTKLNKSLERLVDVIQNRARFYARQINHSIEDAKRVDENLNRLIVTRCEIDMLQIKIEYEHLFRRTLYAQIKSTFPDRYRTALLELIRQRNTSEDDEPTQNNRFRSTTRQTTREFESPTVSRSQSARPWDRPSFYSKRTSLTSLDDSFNRSFSSRISSNQSFPSRNKFPQGNTRSFVPMERMNETVQNGEHW